VHPEQKVIPRKAKEFLAVTGDGDHGGRRDRARNDERNPPGCCDGLFDDKRDHQIPTITTLGNRVKPQGGSKDNSP
jgi:hypothetical protein